MPTAIEWAEETWNPTTGCDRISPGCAHCYALTLAKRLKAMGQPRYQKDGGRASGPGFGLTLHPDVLMKPLSWRTPKRVFVDSMSDLFHEDVPFDFIDQVFAVMALTPQHTYQVLTKRPERMRKYLQNSGPDLELEDAYQNLAAEMEQEAGRLPWPLPNVWLGVTVENQRWADERIPILLDTPAAVRFLSCEPLLGPVKLTHIDLHDSHPTMYQVNALTDVAKLDWVIVGGESAGPEYRRLVVQREIAHRQGPLGEQRISHYSRWFEPRANAALWVTSLRDQCVDAGVPFFFKQWGGPKPKSGGRLLDGRTWDEFPEVRVD